MEKEINWDLIDLNMGTNYYIRLDDDRSNDIHVGKSSFGWKFIFQVNSKQYSPNKVGVNRFLKLHRDKFYDEYGSNVDIGEFWELVEQKKDGVDVKTYHNYPDCLKFYDNNTGELIPEDEIIFKNPRELQTYKDLPFNKSVLEHFLQEETIVDGLVFHDAEFS